MYFVRYDPLKEKLRSRTLSDREALPYLMVFSVLSMLTFVLPMCGEFNTWDWIDGGLSVLLVIGGVFYAYVRNGADQGFDFIQKYTVLGWVTVVRCVLVFMPIVIVTYIVADLLSLTTEETGWFDVFVGAIFQVILYQRISRHIADTRLAPTSAN